MPVAEISVDGFTRVVLVDSGCSRCIVYAPCCVSWKRQNVSVVTVNGQKQRCAGVGRVCLQVRSGNPVEVEAFVVEFKPLGFECILGVNGIVALGGVTILPSLDTCFGSAASDDSIDKPVCASAIEVDEPDFHVLYEAEEKKWTVAWKWANDSEPDALRNTLAEHTVSQSVRAEYEAEIEEWIRNGWLKPYDERKYGPVKGLIPLMAVVQQNKAKVRPVMDFRELNTHVDAFTASADVCADKLREWRRQGTNVAVVDLRKAYLQIHVHESLWPFQTVIFRGQRYCLTRLGFGLNVAPNIMKAVLAEVLSQNDVIQQATSPYLDDVFVNEDVASSQQVEGHLSKFGLVCKPAERLTNGTRVLGLEVWGEQGKLLWKRSNALGEVPRVLTRRTVFSFCGKLIGHLPVCGWLRVATAFIKRRANALSSTWDEKIDDEFLNHMLEDTLQRVKLHDPAKGRWDVDGEEAIVWVDASSLATGAAVEVAGHVVEDGSWLRSEDASHINMAELDAVVKGVNMAILWNMKKIHLRTDSATVYHWVSDTLSGKARVKTKAASEMLVRRRLSIIKSLIEEYRLDLDVTLIASGCNLADVLTRVPEKWFRALNGKELSNAPVAPVCGAAMNALTDEQVDEIHRNTGHYGVKRTLYFVRKTNPMVTRKDVQRVVQACQICQSIDPASKQWKHGQLGVNENWQRVGMDITHFESRHYLSLIDCGPSRFAVWRRLRRQDSASVIQQLEAVFYERGAPAELLTDNDTVFRSRMFGQFADRWGIHVHFRCAYIASGNGIVERCHRSVKRIAARKQCSIAEAVYWYNLAPKDSTDQSTAPASVLYNYDMRVYGIDRAPPEGLSMTRNPYDVGETVWVRPPGNRCDTRFSRGTVTKVISDLVVEVDGMPRHIRDLRQATPVEDISEAAQEEETDSDDDILGVNTILPPTHQDTDSDTEEEGASPTRTPLPRRSLRERRSPDRYSP